MVNDTYVGHCASCDAGHRLTSNNECEGFAGACANGQLADQAKRTHDSHCGKCDKGYKLLDAGTLVTQMACVAYAGTCAGGDLAPQEVRPHAALFSRCLAKKLERIRPWRHAGTTGACQRPGDPRPCQDAAMAASCLYLVALITSGLVSRGVDQRWSRSGVCWDVDGGSEAKSNQEGRICESCCCAFFTCPLQARRGDNQCGSCSAGYRYAGKKHVCVACTPGFFSADGNTAKSCTPYKGACANGKLKVRHLTAN